MQQTRDPHATCDAYMEWCASKATLPVFFNFADYENYYKLVYDFDVYDNVDGSYAGQQAVTNTYPMQTANGIQAVNVLNGRFDTAYLRDTIEKQMSAMNRYNENLHADLEGLADRMVESTGKHSTVTAEMEARYLELSKDPEGNRELLQKMVDEAAKAAGYSTKLYHGTDYYEQINVFKKGKYGFLGPGIYLTARKDRAQYYANKSGYVGTIYNLYAKISNPLTVKTDNPAREILRAIYGNDKVFTKREAANSYGTRWITSADIKKLQGMGYDSIVWDYAMDKETSVFDSNSVKSADPVTYDKKGKIIPLSERFNSEKEDIRYSEVRSKQKAEQDMIRKFTGKIRTDSFVSLSGIEYNNIRSNVKSGNAHAFPDGLNFYVDSGTQHKVYRYYFTYDSDNSITVYDTMELTDNQLLNRDFTKEKYYEDDDRRGFQDSKDADSETEANASAKEYGRVGMRELPIQGQSRSNDGLAGDGQKSDGGGTAVTSSENRSNSGTDAQESGRVKRSVVTKTQAQLARENKELRERIAYWKGQTKLTETATANKSDVQKAARELLKEYGSKADKVQVRDALQKLADYIVSDNNGYGIDNAELTEMANEIAETIMSEVSVRDDDGQETLERLTDDVMRNAFPGDSVFELAAGITEADVICGKY